MSVLVTIIFLQNVFNCPMFGNYCPKKVKFVKQVITPYVVRFSHLNYFEKTSYIVPFQTPYFVYFGQYCPKSHLDFFDKVNMVGHYIELAFQFK